MSGMMGRGILNGILGVTVFSGLAAFPAVADTQAIVGELEAKAAACEAVAVETFYSKQCAKQCASYAHRLKNAQGLRPGEDQQLLDACKTFEARVDFDAAPAPSAADIESMATDMLAKARACGAVSPRTREAHQCNRVCTGGARNVRARPNLSKDVHQRYQNNCNAAYTKAGFSLATPTPTPPTIAERVAAMPAKEQFCRARLASLNCSRTDLYDTEHACYQANACAMQCARTELASRIEGATDPGVQRRGMRALSACERSYGALQGLVGE